MILEPRCRRAFETLSNRFKNFLRNINEFAQFIDGKQIEVVSLYTDQVLLDIRDKSDRWHREFSKILTFWKNHIPTMRYEFNPKKTLIRIDMGDLI